MLKQINKTALMPILALLLTLIVSSVSAQEIYVYREADGVVHFTSRKPSQVKFTIFNNSNKISKLSYKISPKSTYKSKRLYLDEHKSAISLAAKKYGVSENLIRAVIHAESAFNARARSRKGALGLMQLMPFNISNVDDPFEPAKNINAGVALLSTLYQEYNGDLELVLAAYNAGQGAVHKHGGVPPYRETIAYIKKVKSLYREYANNFASHIYRG